MKWVTCTRQHKIQGRRSRGATPASMKIWYSSGNMREVNTTPPLCSGNPISWCVRPAQFSPREQAGKV
ncbi:MAG: hypothetical protein JKY23_04305 [Nitrospinaceae bacterium]|nr:hypothetical protein [Nitrospinaceae bacterium]